MPTPTVGSVSASVTGSSSSDSSLSGSVRGRAVSSVIVALACVATFAKELGVEVKMPHQIDWVFNGRECLEMDGMM